MRDAPLKSAQEISSSERRQRLPYAGDAQPPRFIARVNGHIRRRVPDWLRKCARECARRRAIQGNLG